MRFSRQDLQREIEKLNYLFHGNQFSAVEHERNQKDGGFYLREMDGEYALYRKCPEGLTEGLLTEDELRCGYACIDVLFWRLQSFFHGAVAAKHQFSQREEVEPKDSKLKKELKC